MVARRIMSVLVATLAAVLVACAHPVSGSGTLAEGAVAPPGSVASGPPSPGSAGSGSAQRSGSTDVNAVCQALSKGKVEKEFRSSVTLTRSQRTGCQIKAADGRSLVVAVFDYLALTDYRRGSFIEVSVAGRPGVKTDANIMYVARSTNPSGDGLVAAYFSGLGEGGATLAGKVLTLLLGRYGK